jgi:hypothetical protein
MRDVGLAYERCLRQARCHLGCLRRLDDAVHDQQRDVDAPAAKLLSGRVGERTYSRHRCRQKAALGSRAPCRRADDLYQRSSTPLECARSFTQKDEGVSRGRNSPSIESFYGGDCHGTTAEGGLPVRTVCRHGVDDQVDGA